ncbi:zinc ABC transporter substrate-binding protein [Pseudorhodobacter sp. W20_MBD10_FR17]|uniref:zinc ABC transporter substrate-binding protein n=1 Tax=Pseudorhodobacter sp. W20_MBD10_FR17 TaxID=3240266 RepID=UPI003F95FC1F
MRGLYVAAAVLAFGQAALADTPKVVTDFGPVQSLVAMVMGDLGTPDMMLPRGGDAHDFQLRPSQAQDLATADLVIWVGPEMTPWMARAMDSLGSGLSLPLLDAPETLTRTFGAKDEGEHAHEGVDPHAWLEPENAQIWLGLIAEALAQTDPVQAETYRANAKAAQAEVTVIEADVAAVLAPIKDKPFAVAHDAYGYFAAHFGLQNEGSLRMGDAAPSGAAHLAELQDLLTADGAVCIFPEANHTDASARQMAEATGARLGAPLDPEGSMLTPGPALYGDLMRGLARSMAECLSQQ